MSTSKKNILASLFVILILFSQILLAASDQVSVVDQLEEIVLVQNPDLQTTENQITDGNKKNVITSDKINEAHVCEYWVDQVRTQQINALAGLSVSAYVSYFVVSKALDETIYNETRRLRNLQKFVGLQETEKMRYQEISKITATQKRSLESLKKAVDLYIAQAEKIKSLSPRHQFFTDANNLKQFKMISAEAQSALEQIDLKSSDSKSSAGLKNLSKAQTLKNLNQKIESLNQKAYVSSQKNLNYLADRIKKTKKAQTSLKIKTGLHRLAPKFAAFLASSAFVAVDLLTYSSTTSAGTLTEMYLSDAYFFNDQVPAAEMCRVIKKADPETKSLYVAKINKLNQIIQADSLAQSDSVSKGDRLLNQDKATAPAAR